MTDSADPPHSEQPDNPGQSSQWEAAGAAPPFAEPVGQARPIDWSGSPTCPDLGFELDRCRRPWADILIFCGLLLASDFLVGVFIGIAMIRDPSFEMREAAVVMVPIRAVVSAVLIWLIVRHRRQTRRSVGLNPKHIGIDLGLGIPATLAAFFMLYLSLGITWLLNPSLFEDASNADNIAEMLPPLRPTMMVGFMVIVACYEELIFRGFLLTRFRVWFKNWPLAIVASSLLFALPHLADQQAIMFAPLFLLGVVLSLFTIWRRSIIPAIVAHTLFNSIQILTLYYRNQEWAGSAGCWP